MATPFAAACAVSVSNNYGTTGTFSKSQLSTLTPEQWKALFTDGSTWNEMTPYLKTQFQMAACGVRRNTFYDWIMSSNRTGMGALVTTHKMDRGPSIIQPFIMARQDSVVNNENWAIVNGWTFAGYTAGSTGPLTSAQKSALGANGVACSQSAYPCRVIRVIPGYGSNYAVPTDAGYFLPRHVITVMSVSSNGAVPLYGQWEIIASAADTAQTYVDVLIRQQFQTGDQGGSTGYADEEAPTNGLVLVGINNVNDYESLCKNRVTVNPRKNVPFFYQTYRDCRRVSSSYMEMFGRLMADNAYFEAFGNLPLAEMNRQDEMMSQREFAISFLLQDKISIAQRLSGSPNWGDLDNILSVTGATIDPGTGDQLIAKRANMVGVRPQLMACSRYFPGTGQTLDIKDWLEIGMYDIFRARDSQGRASARNIDVRMNSTLADQFQMAFVKYSNWKLDDKVRIVIEQGDNIGVQWNRYKLYKPQGVYLNVIVENFFDDLSNSFDQIALNGTPAVSAAQATAIGNKILTLDLGKGGTIYPALLDSNRTEFTTGQIQDLAKLDTTFSCAMKNPTIKTACTSKTVTAIVECPLNSRWDENISGLSFATPV